MTAEHNPQKLSPDQITVLTHILAKTKGDEVSIFEMIYGAMLLVQNGYATPDDYPYKVAMHGEKQVFINYIEEALWLNNEN